MTDQEALKVVLAGPPKYPPRATHPEDSRDDERDFRNDCRSYEAAKAQIQRLVAPEQERGRHIPD